MKHVLVLTYALSLLGSPVMAQSIDPPNIVGSLSIVSPPESAPVNTVPGQWAGVPGLSTLVQSRSGDNLEITASAEVMTTSSVWLAARVDGAIIEPDVVFKRGGTFWDGSRSFTFVKQGVSSGTHTVEIMWFTNPGTSAQIRDRSLSVSSASPVWGEGRLAVAVAASGPDLVKTTGVWENIPGLSTTIATDATREFKMTFSAEVGAGTGRFFARALVDGGYVADVLLDSAAAANGGTRSFTFVKNGVPAGTHTVTMQWLASGGQIRLGDRTLAVTAAPSTTTGGGLMARGFEGAPTGFTSADWVDVPNTTQSFLTNEMSTNLQLTFGAEARTTGGRLFLRALIDGRPLSPGDITYVGDGFALRAQSYSFVQKNVTPGKHTVRLQAAVDAGAYGEVGDLFVTALFKRRPGADFAQPYASMAPKSGSGPPVVVIGFDPHRAGVARPTMQQLQNLHRGDDGGPSMRSWYLENSGGRYAPSNFTFLGWYDAPIARQGTWYWDTGNFGLMWQDALIAADAAFNFRQYDINGDGYISSTELAVEVVRPQTDPSGTNRSVSAPLDGTTLGVDIIDLYVSADDGKRIWNVGLLAHEMAHAILGAADMYAASATRPGQYSLMDAHGGATHLDPFHKLKNGFLSPDVIEINSLTPRTVPLTAVEKKGAAIILYSPSYRTDQEYFVIENRWGGTVSQPNYDAPLNLEGVVVWHIVQDPTLMNQFPPPGANATAGDWGRLAVRRVAVLNRSGEYIDLKWANGSRTNVRITALDVAQETVKVDINHN